MDLMRLLLIAAICMFSLPASAFQAVTYTHDTFNKTFIYPNVPKFSPPPTGGLAWDVFQTTTEDYVMGKGDEANVIKEAHPTFSKEMEAYDGKTVTMNGYMFPLEDTDGQSKFLFGPFPITCPFHYHVPPTLVIETHAKTPMAFTYEPMVLTGMLHLVRGQTHEPYYTMSDAVLSKDLSVSIVEDTTAPKKSFNPLFHGTPMAARTAPGAIPDDAPSAGDYKAQ